MKPGTSLFLAVLAIAFASLRAEPDVAPPVDVVPYAGLSPEDACKFATLPPGFKLYPFAGEPDIKQPIAFCEDHRGRIWVAEGNTYPVRAAEGEGQDRII